MLIYFLRSTYYIIGNPEQIVPNPGRLLEVVDIFLKLSAYSTCESRIPTSHSFLTQNNALNTPLPLPAAKESRRRNLHGDTSREGGVKMRWLISSVLSPIGSIPHPTEEIEAYYQTSSNVHMKIIDMAIQSWMTDENKFLQRL